MKGLRLWTIDDSIRSSTRLNSLPLSLIYNGIKDYTSRLPVPLMELLQEINRAYYFDEAGIKKLRKSLVDYQQRVTMNSSFEVSVPVADFALYLACDILDVFQKYSNSGMHIDKAVQVAFRNPFYRDGNVKRFYRNTTGYQQVDYEGIDKTFKELEAKSRIVLKDPVH